MNKNFNLEMYKNNSLICFSLKIETDENNKKILKNVPKHSLIDKFDEKYINKKYNGIAIRTGTKTDDNKYIIGLDIDNKPDTDDMRKL
jgi:hypothetical protein